MKNLWVDMDGVMNVYDITLYTSKKAGETPPFLIPRSHVFATLEENPNLMAAFNSLYKEYREDPEVSINVLTSIPVGLLQAEHTLDKFEWCKKHIPDFSPEDFYCVSVPKHAAVIDVLWPLTKDDILIDDYPKNLANWVKRGGTAVKCVNGINSYNELYTCIDTRWQPEEIIRVLKEVIRH